MLYLPYFKKAELSETYHVSEKTVTNWVRQAKDGKLALELYEAHGRAWIANTTKNITLIEELIEKHRKFRNSRGVKAIAPSSEFYGLYSQSQIFDIVTSLDIRREIPFQYGYFGAGAAIWDKYAKRLAEEEMPNLLTNTIRQLNTSQTYIDDLLARYSKVNVVDVGVGNALPVRGFLQHLVDKNNLGRYIAVDLSPSMLGIARRNIQKWFGTQVGFESFTADINHERFTEVLMAEAIGENVETAVTVVLLLGGTLANLISIERALHAVRGSMNRNDLFIYNLKLDSVAARHYFDFDTSDRMERLDAKTRVILDLLNIDESFYEVERGFDEECRERYIRIRLKVAVMITFSFEQGERTITLNKNDTVMLWRYWHQTAPEVVEQLDCAGFDVLQTSLTEDKNYLLTVSRIKSEQ